MSVRLISPIVCAPLSLLLSLLLLLLLERDGVCKVLLQSLEASCLKHRMLCHRCELRRLCHTVTSELVATKRITHIHIDHDTASKTDTNRSVRCLRRGASAVAAEDSASSKSARANDLAARASVRALLRAGALPDVAIALSSSCCSTLRLLLSTSVCGRARVRTSDGERHTQARASRDTHCSRRLRACWLASACARLAWRCRAPSASWQYRHRRVWWQQCLHYARRALPQLPADGIAGASQRASEQSRAPWLVSYCLLVELRLSIGSGGNCSVTKQWRLGVCELLSALCSAHDDDGGAIEASE